MIRSKIAFIRSLVIKDFMAITGNTGGGKSYRAVQFVMQAIAEGRPVVTNLPMTFEHPLLYAWDWLLLDAKNTNGLPYPNGALYMLDESWRMDTMSTTPRKNVPLLSFFKEHRHRTNSPNHPLYWQYTKDGKIDVNRSSIGVSDDIFLVTQDLADINSAIRPLCKKTIICIKPTELGVSGASLRMYHEGAVTGVKLVQKKLENQEIEFFKPEIFACYKTDTMGGGGGHNKENTAFKQSWFGTLKFKFFLVLLLVSMGGCVALMSYVNEKVAPKYIGKPITQVQPLRNTEQPAQPLRNTEQPVQPLRNTEQQKPAIVSIGWRVSGVVENKKNHKQVVYLSDLNGHIKRVASENCTHDSFGQYDCAVEGERVTFFTGAYLSTDKAAPTVVSNQVQGVTQGVINTNPSPTPITKVSQSQEPEPQEPKYLGDTSSTPVQASYRF